MTNASDQKTNSDMANKASADVKTTLAQDIRGKWDKFSEIEVGALKSDDDLVDQVVAKYSLDKTQAKTDVTALLAGRHI